MANLKIIIDGPLMDGHRVTFKAPCACTGIDKLDIRYIDDNTQKSKLFTMKDTHGNNLTGLGNLFDEGAYVQAILSLSDNGAYLQNAATNGYLEGKFTGVQGQLDGKQSRVELLENVDLHSIANSDDMFKDYIFKVTSGTYADYHLPPESGHWGVSIRSSYMTNWDNGMLIIAHNRNSGNIYVCNKVSGKYSVWKKVSVSGEWTYTKVIDSKYSGQVNTDVLQHMYVTAKATVNGNVMTGSVFIGELGLWGSKNIYLAHGSSWCKFDVTSTYVKVSYSGDVQDDAVAYFMDK